MRIGVLSDLHVHELGKLPRPAEQPDVLVLAGNIGCGIQGLEWAAHAYTCPIVYVLGNYSYRGHDVETFDDELRALAWGSNIHFLQNESLIIRGVRFIGSTLWTDFGLLGDAPKAMRQAGRNSADYRHIRKGRHKRLTPLDTFLLHQESVDYLRRTATEPYDEGHTVVVTHHAPSLRSVPAERRQEPSAARFASHLDGLVQAADAMLWVHAGDHGAADYLIGTTRVVANPRSCTDGNELQTVDGFRADYVVNI